MPEAVQLINLFDAGVQNTGDAAPSAQAGASAMAGGPGGVPFSDLLGLAENTAGDIPILADQGGNGPLLPNPLLPNQSANDNQSAEGAALAAALAVLEGALPGEAAQAGARAGQVVENTGQARVHEIAAIQASPAPDTDEGGDTDTDSGAHGGTAGAAQLSELSAGVLASAPLSGDDAADAGGEEISQERPHDGESNGEPATTLAGLDAAALQQSTETSPSAVAAIASTVQSLTQAQAAGAQAAASTVAGTARIAGRADAAAGGGGEPGATTPQDGAEIAGLTKPNGEAAKAAVGTDDGDGPGAATRQNAQNSQIATNSQSTNSAHAQLETSGRMPGESIGERSGSSSALFQTTSETPVFASPPETAQTVVRAALQANNLVALPVRTIAVHIANRLADGLRSFQIRLDPPELGRIDIRMEIARDGNLTAQLTVDRPEALDALNRDSRALERALQAAGLELEEGALEFLLRRQNAEDGATDEDGASQDGSDTAGDDEQPAGTHTVSLNALDIRV